MSMKHIQFQAGLSLRDFQNQYGTEAQCESAVFAAPAGPMVGTAHTVAAHAHS